MDSRKKTSVALLIDHLGKILSGVKPALPKAGHSGALNTAALRQRLDASYPDEEKGEVGKLMKTWALHLKEGLEQLPKPPHTLTAAAALQTLTPRIHAILDLLKKQKDYQTLLGAFAQKQVIEKEISRNILKRIVDLLVTQNQIASPMDKVIQRIFDNQDRPLSEQLQALENLLPSITEIVPTVCYFPAKAGHVAVGVLAENIPHDLIMCTVPLPTVENELEDYLKSLPINPQHNAILVAPPICELKIREIPEKSSIKEIIQNLEGETTLTLIRQGANYYLYSRPLGEEKWKETALKDLDVEQTAALQALFPPADRGKKERTILGSDPRLLAFMKTLRNYHSEIRSNVFYLAKKESEDPGKIHRITLTNRELERLNQQLQDAFPPEEKETGPRSKAATLEEKPELGKNVKYVKTLQPAEFKELSGEIRSSNTLFTLMRTAPTTEEEVTAKMKEQPILVKDGNQFSLYGCKDSVWQKTALFLSKDERTALEELFNGKSLTNNQESCFIDRGCAAESILKRGHDFFEKIPTFAQYLTYGMRPGALGIKQIDDLRSTVSQTTMLANVNLNNAFEAECETYTHEKKTETEPGYVLIALPPCKISDYERAKKTFKEKEKNTYSFKDNTCATAVDDFIKQTQSRYKPSSDNTILPSTCAERAYEIQKKYIEHCRRETLTDPKRGSFDKAQALLKLEKRRLEVALQQDKVTISGYAKSSKIKTKKITKLEGLLEKKDKKELEEALQIVIKELTPKRISLKKNETLAHLKECLRCLKDKDSSLEISVRTGDPSAPDSHLPMRARPAIAHHPERTKQAKWRRIEGNGSSLYCYTNLNRTHAKENLLAALSRPSLKIEEELKTEPLFHAKHQARASIHILDNPVVGSINKELRFGLVEELREPGKDLHSEIIPPQHPLTTQQWLVMIDHQYAESSKLLGKKGGSLTIHSLDKERLAKAGLSLEPHEVAYMQYCLAMKLSCSVMTGEIGEAEYKLSTKELKSYLAKAGENDNAEALRSQIEEARTSSASYEIEESVIRNSF